MDRLVDRLVDRVVDRRCATVCLVADPYKLELSPAKRGKKEKFFLQNVSFP